MLPWRPNIKILRRSCMLIVFVVTSAVALLPLKGLRRESQPSQAQTERSDKIRSFCNCLAGGVFLATAVNHSHCPDTSKNGHSHGHSHYGNIGGTKFLHSIILLLALSVHSVFEGMALGLQEDIKQIIYLLVAMVAHESLAAFALGASLLKSEVQLSAYIVYGVIFSSMIPLGAAIGVGIQSNHSFGADVCSAVMQAVAAGIFIFVTFFEILNHEFESGKYRGQKLLFTAIGYAALALLQIVG
eukprot:XP_011661022.1 PREDICTED: zinc transporter ZIP3-like [Strongylocentrotus purpuratus]